MHHAYIRNGGAGKLDLLTGWSDDETMRKLILVLLAACAACSTGAPAPQTGQGDTLARIRALAADAACTEDSQCHSLALGARACGGPEGYLAWSSAHTRPAEIQALGQQYQAERRAANTASGTISTCVFLPDPGAECRAGTCQLRKNGAPAVM